MIAEILSVGTELLLGNIVDTNQAFLSRELAELGISVYFRQTCGDNRERLEQTVRLALSRSDLVVITGGLGPTYDDITKSCVAEVMEMPMREDPAIVEKLRLFFKGMGKEMTPNNLSQALVPEGGRILENEWGTAPGLWLEKDGKTVIMMPGVPREMKPMFLEKAKPLLLEKCEVFFHSVTLHLYGIGESDVDEMFARTFFKQKNPTVAPYAKEGETELRITASAPTHAEAKKMCEDCERELFPLIGQYIYSDTGESLPEVLIRRFSENDLRFSLEEKGTGGALRRLLSEVPGADGVLKENAPIKLTLSASLDPEKEDYGAIEVKLEKDGKTEVFPRAYHRGKKEAPFLCTLAMLWAMACLLRKTALFREKIPQEA